MKTKQDSEKWVEFPDTKRDAKAKRLLAEFQETFSFKNVVNAIISLLIGFVISESIEQPFLLLAHYIRTLQLLEYDVISSIILIGIVAIFVILIYLFLKPQRKPIEEQFKSTKRNLYVDVVSIIFAFSFLNILLEISLAFSYFIQGMGFIIDLGIIMDEIIASMILLLLYIAIYFIYKHTNITLKKRAMKKCYQQLKNDTKSVIN